jgi:hypothetical protein
MSFVIKGAVVDISKGMTNGILETADTLITATTDERLSGRDNYTILKNSTVTALRLVGELFSIGEYLFYYSAVNEFCRRFRMHICLSSFNNSIVIHKTHFAIHLQFSIFSTVRTYKCVYVLTCMFFSKTVGNIV